MNQVHVLPAFANHEEILAGRERNAVGECEALHQHRGAPRGGIEVEHPAMRPRLQHVQVPGM